MQQSLTDDYSILVQAMAWGCHATSHYQCWPRSISPYGINDHNELTHWGRVTHICICKLTIIDSDNSLSPGRRQAVIWTNAGILLIGPLGTNFNEILIGIQTFSFMKMHLKMLSAQWRPFCLGLNVLTYHHPCTFGEGGTLAHVKTWTRKGNSIQMINPSFAKNSIFQKNYHQTCNISSTLVENKTVDHSDVVGATPVGAAPTTSLFST